jgi:aromatic amino acid aminotransferase I
MTAGMFIFLAVHISSHPDYDSLVQKGEDATRVLMEKLWLELAEHLVLFAPGWGFDAGGEHAIGGDGLGYFRLSFSIATYEETRTGIDRFAKVLNKFYRL